MPDTADVAARALVLFTVLWGLVFGIPAIWFQLHPLTDTELAMRLDCEKKGRHLYRKIFGGRGALIRQYQCSQTEFVQGYERF